jgi:hypothetical protein
MILLVDPFGIGKMPTLLVGNNGKLNCRLLVFDKDGTIVEQKPVLLCLAKARFSSLAHLLTSQVAEKWAKAVGVNYTPMKSKVKAPWVRHQQAKRF